MNGADVNEEDFNMKFPIHIAIKYAGKEVLKLLYENCNINLKLRNLDGYSPFEYALRNKKLYAFKSIVRFC